MNDREFVRKFSEITMTKVCEKEKVCRKNLYRLSEDKLKRVREQIESEIAKLYIKEE